jgi:small subunit ribosomal protein S6
MKRSYELMVILRADTEVTEESAEDFMKKMVGTEGTVASVSVLGKKELAYPIQKQTQGTYILAKLDGAAVRVGELEKKVQMDTSVLRYLLTLT